MKSGINGRMLLRAGFLAGLALLVGCSNNNVVERSSPRAVVTAPQSGGGQRSVIGTPGNPPFYEVFGRRYHVLSTSDGFRERGVASWYGPDFHGKPTSGGEIYDMHAMTAAHKTLPIPTWVEVTNLSNGRQVIVRVNDRGPFVDDRVIDLSYRAAQELDMIGHGTARVQVRALGAPVGGSRDAVSAPVLAQNPPSRSSGSSDSGFSLISSANAASAEQRDNGLYVQVGAYSSRDNALGMVSRLKQSGFDNTFVLAGGDDSLYRVRIGPLSDSGQFDRVRRELSSLGLRDSRLVTSEF